MAWQVFRRGFRTEREAKAALKIELANDADLVERDDGLTVGMVLDQFIRGKRLAGKATGTINQYEWAADHIRRPFGTWQATRLTSDHLDAFYVDHLAAKLSARSVEIFHKTVKAAFSPRLIAGSSCATRPA